jgi:tRNA (cytidine56-2'-O)-methyltransferase
MKTTDYNINCKLYILYMGNKVYKVNILKLDHRPERDKRITTHCALVARAFGASSFFYSGIEDSHLSENIEGVCKKFGGDIKVAYCDSPVKFVKNWPGKKIHLTMYGEQITKVIKKIKNTSDNYLIIVGGPKVPAVFYDLADFNIAVTNQPHSEVAAIAITLNLLYPNILKNNINYKNNKIKIVPCKNGKKVINIK